MRWGMVVLWDNFYYRDFIFHIWTLWQSSLPIDKVGCLDIYIRESWKCCYKKIKQKNVAEDLQLLQYLFFSICYDIYLD